MTNANLTSFRPIRKLIPMMPDSDLSRLASEGYALATFDPRILTMIDRDRDAVAVSKKKQRLEDKEWLIARGKTPLLSIDGEGDDWASDLELRTGRPRMPVELVLIFILIRGYYGGFKDRKTAMLLLESKTVEILLSSMGLDMPGLSTILDNINAVSTATLDFILDVQIRSAKTQQLDTFAKLTVDSTDVEANSVWPTDSGTISGLASRAEHLLRGLAEFGVALKLPAIVKTLIADLEIFHKQIQLSTGKSDSAAKRTKLYRKLIKSAKKVHKMLCTVLVRAEGKAQLVEQMPSIGVRMRSDLAGIKSDLQDLTVAIKNADNRVLKSRKVPAKDKVLSLSDDDAAMIVKGSRDPVLGYKPQVARSENGFITSIIVPEGNAADSDQLRQIVDASIKRTGVVPKVLSFDDGYTNKEDRDHYLGAGIAIVSFSGSKGKRLIPAEEYDSKPYRDARNDRSAVESTMFTLKHNHDFDRVMRRGIDRVRSELIEKSVAHNFFRMIAISQALEKKRRAA